MGFKLMLVFFGSEGQFGAFSSQSSMSRKLMCFSIKSVHVVLFVGIRVYFNIKIHSVLVSTDNQEQDVQILPIVFLHW